MPVMATGRGNFTPKSRFAAPARCRLRANLVISGRKHIYKTRLKSGICENHLIVKYISYGLSSSRAQSEERSQATDLKMFVVGL